MSSKHEEWAWWSKRLAMSVQPLHISSGLEIHSHVRKPSLTRLSNLYRIWPLWSFPDWRAFRPGPTWNLKFWQLHFEWSVMEHQKMKIPRPSERWCGNMGLSFPSSLIHISHDSSHHVPPADGQQILASCGIATSANSVSVESFLLISTASTHPSWSSATDLCNCDVRKDAHCYLR